MEDSEKNDVVIEGRQYDKLVALEVKSVGSAMSYDSMFVNPDPSLQDFDVLSPGDVIELANKTYKVLHRMHELASNEDRLVYLVTEEGVKYAAITNAENEHELLVKFADEKKSVFPKCIAYSKETYQILIMEYCGENISEKAKKKSIKELAALTIEILFQLSLLSSKDFCHRNISPRTICEREEEVEGRVKYSLIGFYLASKNRTEGNIEVVGKTPDFCSLPIQEGEEFTFSDDLLSLLYLLCFLSNGELPWNKDMKGLEIREKKRSFDVVKSLPREFEEFSSECIKLRRGEKPDYEELIKIVKKNL